MAIQQCRDLLKKDPDSLELWNDYLKEYGRGRYTGPYKSYWREYMEYLQGHGHTEELHKAQLAFGPEPDLPEEGASDTPHGYSKDEGGETDGREYEDATSEAADHEKENESASSSDSEADAGADTGSEDGEEDSSASDSDRDSLPDAGGDQGEEQSDSVSDLSSDANDTIYTLIAQGLERLGYSPSSSNSSNGDVLTVRRQGVPDTKVDGHMPKWFKRCVKLVACGQEVMLVGPAGSGKSFTSRQIAKALNLNFYATSMSAGVDESILQGWLLPVGEGGKFEYVYSVFATAFKFGGVMLIDELDAADPNMLLIINDAVANGEFIVPMKHEDPVIKRHPDFRLIVAANTFGHGSDRKYVGRNQLDEATLSRFRMGQIFIDFDEKLEKKIFDERVVDYGHTLRKRIRNVNGWLRDVSTRDIAKAHQKLEQWDEAEEVFYEYFADWDKDDLKRISVEVSNRTMKATLA
jgi:MoxR-like ATPase